MQATPKFLSIPPYISTSWENIVSLHLQQNGNLIIDLQGGGSVEIPSLNKELLASIFAMHAQVLESRMTGGVAEPFISTVQHNPQQADLPPLPPAFLQKIAAMARMLGFEETNTLPQTEPNCHCIFCQVMNSFQSKPEEESVSADELTFKDWEITQVGDKLYTVTNPLDKAEEYRVFLGSPLGCTCGQKKCDHIRSVLNS